MLTSTPTAALSGPLATMPLERLVPAAQQGDARAREEIVVRFGRVVAGATRSFRLSEADAADAAQTAWVHVLQSLPALAEPRALGAWALTIARRECLRIKRRRTDLPSDDLPEPVDEAEPHDGVLAAERAALVREALAALSERDQRLLGLLAADDEPSYDVIASTLGIPRGSIGPTRARALERLRRELMRRGVLGALAPDEFTP